MDGWNLALLAVAGYMAVVTLVRLMIRRRNEMLHQFRQEMAKEKGQGSAEGEKPSRKRVA